MRIIDSIKRINASVSSIREVLPGLTYFIPKTDNKLDAFSSSREEFISNVCALNLPLSKAIYSTYTVDASKNEPKVYDVVLDELGTDKETTWVFEDALYAAKTAKKNGYNVVGIYDKSEPNQDQLKEIVDIYINNYNELEII